MSGTESEPATNDNLWKPSISFSEDGQPIIHAPLELNLGNVGEFNELVASQFGEKGVKTMEIDLSQIQFIDSITLTSLLNANTNKPRGVSIVLSGVTDEKLKEIYASNPKATGYFEIKELPAPDQE